jgi:hypothetical protein
MHMSVQIVVVHAYVSSDWIVLFTVTVQMGWSLHLRLFTCWLGSLLLEVLCLLHYQCAPCTGSVWEVICLVATWLISCWMIGRDSKIIVVLSADVHDFFVRKISSEPK